MKYRIQNEEGIWLDEKAFTGIFLEMLKNQLAPYIDMVGGAGSIIIDSSIPNALSIEDEFGVKLLTFNPTTGEVLGSNGETLASPFVEVDNVLVYAITGSWNQVATGLPNAKIEILIEKAAGAAAIAGVRVVGSTKLPKSIANNGKVTVISKTDSNGNIELYQGNNTFTFTVLSKLN